MHNLGIQNTGVGAHFLSVGTDTGETPMANLKGKIALITGGSRSLGRNAAQHLADAGAPTLIRENEASPALYVLMPMRV